MLEIEVKYRVGSFDPIRRRLAEWGAEPLGTRTDEDRYFNAPDRDFRATGEALRLRRIAEENRLTYKGPRIERQTKTRPEIEVVIAPGEASAADLARLLSALGYRPAGLVRKSRERYQLRRDGFAVEISLDLLEGIGRFAELEIVAPEDQLERARGVLLGAAGELGLGEPEQRSYLEMVLEREEG
ncbi:MAG TPA: class IV adenylate cyclase [Gemmataceae bacterium]